MLLFSSPSFKSVEVMKTFPTIDYSEQLKAVKERMGAVLKCHPDYDPLENVQQYEPWQIAQIKKAKSLKGTK